MFSPYVIHETPSGGSCLLCLIARPLDVCFLSFWGFAGIMATLESFVGRSCIPEDPQLRYVVPVEPKKSPADHPAVATKNKWTHAGHEGSDSMALPMVADKKDRS